MDMPCAAIPQISSMAVTPPCTLARRRRCADDRSLGREALEELDCELARLARSNGARRLYVGELLQRMNERSWQHELGFSSLTAYALERCGQKGRWAEECCWMARK